jgi:DNA-binding MarR family transcriptional regulator
MHHDMTTDRRHTEALGQILLLVVLLNDDMTQSLAALGLTQSRTRVLWELRQRGRVTQRELAEALGVSPRTITGLIDGLVATGFVAREPHPTDRRAIHVTFTVHGTRTVEELERAQHQLADLLFGDMSDRQLAGLRTGLGIILAKLQAHGLSATLHEDGP